MILKYIIIKNSGAILFPEVVSHSQVGNLFTEEPMIPESAGFAVIEDGKCVGAYGEAVSMNGLKHLPGDQHVINDTLSPASLIKYYRATTQSVREEGLKKDVDARPGLLVIKVPENWSTKDLDRFRAEWKRVMLQPHQPGHIKIIGSLDNSNQVVK